MFKKQLSRQDTKLLTGSLWSRQEGRYKKENQSPTKSAVYSLPHLYYTGIFQFKNI